VGSFNQKGFSLIQVMVAAGILSGLSLVVMELADRSNRIQKSASLGVESGLIETTLFKIISDPELCSQNFSYLANPALISAGPTSVSEIYRSTDTTLPPYLELTGAQSKIGSLQVKSMYISNKAEDIKTIRSPDIMEFTLYVILENTSTSSKNYGTSEKIFRIPFTANVCDRRYPPLIVMDPGSMLNQSDWENVCPTDFPIYVAHNSSTGEVECRKDCTNRDPDRTLIQSCEGDDVSTSSASDASLAGGGGGGGGGGGSGSGSGSGSGGGGGGGGSGSGSGSGS